jgi:hypothetical protein
VIPPLPKGGAVPDPSGGAGKKEIEPQMDRMYADEEGWVGWVKRNAEAGSFQFSVFGGR